MRKRIFREKKSGDRSQSRYLSGSEFRRQKPEFKSKDSEDERRKARDGGSRQSGYRKPEFRKRDSEDRRQNPGDRRRSRWVSDKYREGSEFKRQKPEFRSKRAEDSRDKYRDQRPEERKKRYGTSEEKKSGFKPFRDDRNSTGFRPKSKWRREDSFRFKAKRRFDKKSDFRNKKDTDQSEGSTVRLNKFIANTGLCSRREADELITTGVITVNGNVVTQLGTKINRSDDVRYNGQPLRGEKQVYLLLNKPKDYITTTDDPSKRNTVMELVGNACKERIYPVGRLDRNSTGLLLFTNDGDLAKRLTHPSHEVKKVYHVELDKNLKQDDFAKIKEGVKLDDGIAEIDDIAYDGGIDKKSIGLELHSGKNRIVRRIFEHLGYAVRKLDRVYYAGLTKKDLPRGRWRFLSEMEVNMLKMQTGAKSIR